MAILRNYTPHSINVYAANDCVDNGRGIYTIIEGATPLYSIESSGVARAESREEVVGDTCGIPTVRMTYGNPIGLPDPQPGDILIVSALTANAAKASGRETWDLRMTAHLVRDSEGKILGCSAFAAI